MNIVKYPKFIFPMVNLLLPDDKAIPGNGVYLGRANIENQTYCALINICSHNAFYNIEPSVEVFLMDTNTDINGCYICIELLEFIHEEKMYSSWTELNEQVQLDSIIAVKHYNRYL